MNTATIEQEVEREQSAANAVSPSQQLHWVIGLISKLFEGQEGLDTFEDPVLAIEGFQDLLGELMESGHINKKSAYLYMDLLLGGLILPDTLKIDHLIAMGATVNKTESVFAIVSKHEIYALVKAKRDELWDE